MKKSLITLGVCIVALGALFSLFPKEKSPSIEERIENLLSQMTLGEKIGQMVLVDKNNVPHVQDVAIYGLGAILSGGGAKPSENTPQGWRDMVKEYTDASRSSRLGIPILYGVDAIHGHNNVPGATIFPHAIGLGAAHDQVLVENIAKATAKEVGATGIFWMFSPNLDAPQDIRWGRVYETFSSDFALNGILGSAYIRGLQHDPHDKTGQINILATAKHYLGVGGMQWGTAGNKDYKIDQGTTLENENTLRAYYLPPFKSAIDAGVLSVMAGLNTFGDAKVSASKYLLTDILKTELGFKGFVVSDWYGIYSIPGGEYAATVTAINAGIDMAMLPFDYTRFMQYMTEAVEKGDIKESRIDDAVRRILRAKFSAGLFDKKSPYNLHVIGSRKHHALAREAVSKSLVLLKNENQALPILKQTKKILIAGSAANNTGRQSGGWTLEWQGVEGNNVPGATSILKGIQASAPRGTEVIFHTDSKEFNPKDVADLGIAIVGEKPYAEGVGDIGNPTVSAEDLETISALRSVSKKLIVIIVSGRPLLLPDMVRDWDAIIAAWLPGSEGAGVADVLFGKKPFIGKLPLPWPKNLNQLPFSPNGIAADNTEPAYQKGFGL